MKVIIGSTSNRKIDVVRKVFTQNYANKEIDFQGHSASSLVPDTPYDKQTHDGAINRAIACVESHPKADFYVGLESGLISRYGELFEEAWACIISKNGTKYLGYSSGLKIPDYVTNKMKELNIEHCDAMTIIEEELGKLPNDTWGTYTGGKLIRDVSLEEALRNALIQILDHEGSLYSK
jgi:non-canonical (house-cleaning) NTP pyrophosphatase